MNNTWYQKTKKAITELSARQLFFRGTTILGYCTTLYTMFVQYSLIESMIYVLVFFSLFHFLFFELYTKKNSILLCVIICLGILMSIILGHFQRQFITAILVFHAGIFFLMKALKAATYYSTTFSARSYFSGGGYIFTVFTTITYSLLLVGLYARFPFSCEELSRASSSVVDTFTHPFELGVEKATTVKKNLTSFFDSSVKDVATVSQDISLSSSSKNPKNEAFIDKIMNFQQTIIQAAITENKAVNLGICDFILEKVNKAFAYPGIQISVFILLFLLLYSFVRIVFWVPSCISTGIFIILRMLGIYKKTTQIREVEIIE